MAGNGRYELSSNNTEPCFPGNYSNGQRANFSGPNLDKTGSYREGVESRMFASGVSASRGCGVPTGDLPALSQCLMLEPIVMGDQKYTRSGELRRVLGFSVGSTTEDNSFGAAHFKPSPHVAVEDLKLFRESVLDTSIKARGRAKKLEEHLHKLNKYNEAVSSKKQQRNELSNERSSGSNLKMGAQFQRNHPDMVSQKLDDRPKNVLLNKRVRTSMAEIRSECRGNALPRPPFVIPKDRDMLKDGSVEADSDQVEEKIRRLPAGGEGWDKKMKRKRSVGMVPTRPIDSDGELKRSMHHKLSSEPGLQSCDSHSFRSGTAGFNKLESASSPASSNIRGIPKNELEKPTFSRDLSMGLNKGRLLAKGINKLSNRDEAHVIFPSPVSKGKASRAPRTGSMVAANSSPNVTRVSGTFESWEQMPGVNKNSLMAGVNNRKRATPSGSSSPPVAQWGGQRPQKISRPRRANLMSQVSNQDEMLLLSEGCPDVGPRLTSSGTNGSLLSRGVVNSSQQFKVKLENIASPARLSESEESGAGENRSKEKVVDSGELEDKAVNAAHSVGSSGMLTKKSKLLMKEEIVEGVRRQGRSGRGSSFSRASISPIRDKLDNSVPTKPLRSTRPGLDRNGSKSGRPLKRLSERKGFSRLGHIPNGGSPDFTGESDDDREELSAAANYACNSSYLACCSPFWKKMEPLFAFVSLEDASNLSQQLKLAEELHENLSQMFGHGNNLLSNAVQEENSLAVNFSSERNGQLQNKIGLEGLAHDIKLVIQSQDATFFGRLDSEKCGKIIPLYERVLSALIMEDDIEEFENAGGIDELLQSVSYDLSYDACVLADVEPQKRDRMDFDYESLSGVQAQMCDSTKKSVSCNGNTTFGHSPYIKHPLCNDELLQRDSGYIYADVEVLNGITRNGVDGPQSLHTEDYGISSVDCQYEQMCLDDKCLLELQSIGLYPETVPNLDDREEEVINQEILQLKKGLCQQMGKKKTCLDKIYKTIQSGRDTEGRDREQVAMDRLVELAYKKQLATRGNIASKTGIPKVSKQVAMAFVKRTLGRCRKFEESGTSCFSEPVLRDILFAPPRNNEAESISCGLAVTNGSFPGNADGSSLDAFEASARLSDQAFARSGPISNRGKKKEVLLDEVVGVAGLRATSTLGSTLLGGTKGKRSERERDKDSSSRGVVAKAGRSSLANYKGERKMKTKPKQKTAQLSVTKFAETAYPAYTLAGVSGDVVNMCGDRKREAGLMSPSNVSQDSSKDIEAPANFGNLQLHELDPIEELGVGTDIGGPQDLSSWLNFDEDGLQDHDSVGLEIPMDDLSELNMF